MKANEYNILDRCISEGVELGLNRAYKHTETPDRRVIHNHIYNAVLHEILEYFNLEDVTQNDDYNGSTSI